METSAIKSSPFINSKIIESAPHFLVALFAFAVYFSSSAPGLTWAHESQDSGELAAACAVLGITHPTGYPLYTIIGGLLIHLFGIFDPARIMVLISVISGAISIGIISKTASIALGIGRGNLKISPATENWLCAIAALFAAINPIIWSQSIICEVYSFAFLLNSLSWFFLVKYIEAVRTGDERRANAQILILGFILGLTLAHHIAGIAFLLPVIIVFIALRNRNPLKSACWLLLPMIPGIALYAYLPIASRLNPPLDWGNPENWVNFSRHVTAWQYRGLIFGTPEPEFIRRLNEFPVGDFWGIVGGFLAVTGIISMFYYGKKNVPLMGIAISILAYSVWIIIFAIGYFVTDYEIYFYPLAIPIVLTIAFGIAFLFGHLGKFHKLLPWLLVLTVIANLGYNFYDHRTDMDLSDPRLNDAISFVTRAMRVISPDSIVIVNTDGHTASLLYAINVGVESPWSDEKFGPRPDLDLVTANLVKYDWFRENVQDRKRLVFNYNGHDRDEGLMLLIEQNFPARPIFIDKQVREIIESVTDKYKFEPYGPLFRLEYKNHTVNVSITEK